MTKNQNNRIQATETEDMRPMRGDRPRNKEIRNDFGVQLISEYIDPRQLSWQGNLRRTSDNKETNRIKGENKNKKKERNTVRILGKQWARFQRGRGKLVSGKGTNMKEGTVA